MSSTVVPKPNPTPTLTMVLKVVCMIPFITGAVDMMGGTKILILAGAALPSTVSADAVLNNQIGFWGAIWLGYGAMLWWVSSDLVGQATIFRILMGTLFLAGIGRALSVIEYGPASGVLSVIMIAELLGAVGLLAWHKLIVRERIP